MYRRIPLIAIMLAYCSVHTCRAAVSWAADTCPFDIPESTSKDNLKTFMAVGDPTNYTILSQNVTGRFAIASNGTLSSLTKLDYESDEKSYSLVIVAVNAVPESVNLSCVIQVTNVNDEKPQFPQKSYSVNIPNNVAKGDSLLNVTATDKDVTAAFNTVGYQIKVGSEAANFTIDGATGNIKAAHSITGPHTFKITVVATDSNEAEFNDEASVSICIGCASGSPTLEKSMSAIMSLVFAVIVM